MSAVGNKLAQCKRFFSNDLWVIDASELPRLQSRLLRLTRVVTAVIQGFFTDRCMLRASALTYATLLSIVPLLALMFALLKGLGVQNTLEPLILEHLALGAEDVVGEIIHYIDNTNVAKLGVVGLAALAFAVLTLLSNIEKSFNHIWGVAETRPLLRRFADYFSVVTIGPIFVLAAISMTSSLASIQLVTHFQEDAYLGPMILLLFKAIPYVGMWITFTALYIFMPNTRVSVSAALIGGIFGGTLWQLAQWGYVHFQVGVGRYNAIYGTMAALPIFMVWIYVSWLIVLLGVEMTYAWQNLRLVSSDFRGSEVNFASREQVALSVMLTLSEVFYRGQERWNAERVAECLGLPPRLTQDVLQQLVRLGFLSEVKYGRRDLYAYQPGRALEALTVHDLLQGLKQDGIHFSSLRGTPERDVVRELEATIEEAGRNALAETTLFDLVKRMLEKQEAAGLQSVGVEKVLSENCPSSKRA